MREPGGSWIKVIRESEAEGGLKEAYAKMREVNNSYGDASAHETCRDCRAGGVGRPVAFFDSLSLAP